MTRRRSYVFIPFMFFLLNYNQYKSFFYSLTTLDWKEIGVPKSQNGLIAKYLIFHQNNCEFGGDLEHPSM